MDANEKQVAGTHYKTNYQHWDLVNDIKLSYFSSQITRYIARWRKKNGIEDLEKALHYMEKMIEIEARHRAHVRGRMETFIFENRLQEHERMVVNMLVNYELGDEERLIQAHKHICELLNIIKGTSPEDPQFRDKGDEWKRP